MGLENAEDVSGFLELLEQYGQKLNNIYVSPNIFIELSLILISVYIIRFIIWVRVTNNKDLAKKSNAYIINHTLLELLFSFIVAYIIVKLTLANPNSYILNCVFAPGVGFFAAFIFDGKVLIPLEQSSINKQSKSSESSSNDTTSTTGNIVNITNIIGENKSNLDSLPDTLNIKHIEIKEEEDLNMIATNTSNTKLLISENLLKIKKYLSNPKTKIKDEIKKSSDTETINSLFIKKINDLQDINHAITDELISQSNELKQFGELLFKINDMVIKVNENLEEFKNKDEQMSYEQRRVRILRFDSDIINGIDNTYGEYQQVIRDVDKYEKYCEEHPEFENSFAEEAILNIREHWREKRKQEELKNKQKNNH